MSDDPLADAIRRRQEAKAAAEAARLAAEDAALDARDRQRAASEQKNEQLRSLGESFVRRAQGIPMKKVWVGERHQAPGGLFSSRGKWVEGKQQRAWVIEQVHTWSGSTGGSSSSGTTLFVLKDGQVITGYSDVKAITDKMAAFLELHGR
jgi:hypothetical protein